jgi:hypothetical protein
MRDGILGDWEWFNSFLLMILYSLESTGRYSYTAPKCRVFAVCVEGCIAQGSPEPGEPGGSNDYHDYNDD